MSASLQEIQELVDPILELLHVRLPAGQMVIHFSEGRVQRVETNIVHKPGARPLRRD